MTENAQLTPSVPPAADGAQPQPDKAPTFDVLPLSRELRETLAAIGYLHPTPVQIAVWEPATRGRDAVVQARTGTGKTAAFGLPIVDQIVKRGTPHVQVLALCPTRELALQVSTEIERLGAKKGIKVCAVYGGAAMQRQIDAIQGGAQVVVGTPGRTLDHLRRGTLDPKHVRMLVLDESDEMLSMGFERELTAILETLPAERQTLLFSATLPPDIERIAKNRLRNPDFLTLSGDHVGALSIQHFVYMVAGDKVGALVRVLEVEDPESAVVFCNTKDETQNVAQALNKKGYDADWLNGDLPQSDREKVMSATREGRLRYLVATDVAARGIDISHLTHVINYDFPMDAEGYVHRTGRTGRAGRTGTAISLVTPHDIGGLYLLRLTYKIRPLEKQIPTEGELKTRAEADLVGMLAEAFGTRSPHPDDLALARRLLTHDRSDVILAGLLRDHLGARPDAKQAAATARKAPRPTTTRAPAPAMPAAPRAARPAEAAPLASPAPQAPARPVVAVEGAALGPPASPKPQPLPGPISQPADTLPGAPSAAVVTGPVAHGGALGIGRPSAAERGRGDRRDRDRDGRRDARDRRRDEPGRDDRRPAPGPGPAAGRGPRREGALPAVTTPRGRPADLVSWQPPEEEGDDEPILGADADPPTPRRPFVGAPAADRRRGPPAAVDDRSRSVEEEPPGDWVELFVNVGRREGARALDLQRVLVDVCGLDKAHVRRIRVRDRNAFVSVLRADVDRALGALNGAQIGSRTASAEIARSALDAAAPDRGARPEGAREVRAEDETPAEPATSPREDTP